MKKMYISDKNIAANNKAVHLMKITSNSKRKK